MRETTNSSDNVQARAGSPGGIPGNARSIGQWRVKVTDPEGNVTFDDWGNLIMNEGLDHYLETTLAGGTQTGTWYIGLTDGTPTVDAGDTMGSHTGWTEQEGYDETDRQTWSPGAVSGQSVDNSGSAATFTITSDSTTVGGAFLTSDSTKGGTTGILFAAGAFSGGDQTLSAGSTLEVTATFTQAAA